MIIEGIEMKIMEDVKKVSVTLHRNFFSAALKECAASFMSFIKVIYIADIKFAQKKRQPSFPAFREQKVIMIFHKAPSMDIYDSLPRNHIWIS